MKTNRHLLATLHRIGRSEETGQETHPDILKAQWERDNYGIPSYVYRAYRAQWHSAKTRGIPWKFGLLRWHLWWKTELRSLGPDAKRGNRRGQFMMCRTADAGAYEMGNVYAGTAASNASDRTEARKASAVARCTATRVANGVPRGMHLKVRGDAHPKSRAVITPDGRFGSISLASEHYGLTRAGAHYRVKSGREGWGYA